MSNSFSDDMFEAAVIKVDRLWINALPSDDQIDHVFSAKFERNMKELILQSKKRESVRRTKVWNKRFLAALVAIIVIISTAMSVSAIRQKVIEFITEVYQKHTQVFFSEIQSSQMESKIFTAYTPSYIPKGFELMNQDTNETVLLEYEKGDDFISFKQGWLDEISMQINTEGVNLEELKFNNLPAKFYSNQGVQNLIWYDSHYMYMVSSTLDRETVFKIAESVKVYRK